MTGSFWLVVGVASVGTLLMRVVPIVAHGRLPAPGFLERLLKHVPAAALAALVGAWTFYVKTEGAYEFAPERTIAASVALLVALKTKNVILTLAVGMAALWAVQAVWPS
jgi:branched-subunit amino acid transport protein